jgi:hypothetical protein
MSHGFPFYAEVVSADASGGVVFTLYRPDISFTGATITAYTLAATEFLVVTDYAIVRTASGAAAIVGASDAAGSRLIKGVFAANGGIVHNLHTPHEFPVGVTPKLIADAGDVRAFLHGFINEA